MDWTLLIIGTLTSLCGIPALHLIWREQHGLPDHMLKKGREPMLADTFLNLPIETVDCEALAPTIPMEGMAQGICIVVGVPIPFDWCVVRRPEGDVLTVGKSWPWTPIKASGLFFSEKENILGQKSHSPLAYKGTIAASSSMTKVSPNTKAQPREGVRLF